MGAPILLVDASIYIFRAYFSLPANWHSDAGFSTEAVYGYATFLLNLIERSDSDYIACCYDQSLSSCFRNDLYPEYKANRALPDEALAFQLDACLELTQLMGLPSFASETYEADDLIGSLVAQVHDSELLAQRAVAIVTRDKDLGQLLTRRQDYLWNFAEQLSLFQPDIREKFGVEAGQLADYLALVGDKIDNIPGVPGVGPKTAVQLLQAYPSVEDIFANLGAIAQLPIRGAGKLPEKLLAHLKQIALAKTLATIVTDVDLPDAPVSLARIEADRVGLEAFCQSMGFARLMPRFERVLRLKGRR